MQDIIITKPYHFIPPRYSAFWAKLIEWWLPTHLRKDYGVTSWEFRNVERLRASLEAGHGVMLASNHSRPCDPQVLGLLSCEVARPFHIMASWHVFMQSRVMAFLLPRIGRHAQRGAVREDHAAFDDVRQLADIAGPGVANKAASPSGSIAVMERLFARACRCMKCRASTGISSRRCRSGGISMGKTFRRQ